MPPRRVLASHTRHRSPHALLRLLSYALVTVLVLATASAGVIGFLVWDSYKRYAVNSVELASDGIVPIPPALSFAPYPGEVNFLLVGTDECGESFAALFGERCAGGGDGGARNDVTLLVHIEQDHSRATVISFPRDLLIEFPDCTTETGAVVRGGDVRQLNTAYDTGGLACVATVVEQLSGYEIPFAAKVDWGGVIELTEQLGGVQVCVANGIYDRHTGLSLAPGTHNLQGLQALQFLRTRHGLSDGSDLARIGNQQLYMAALVQKLTSDGTLEDFPRLIKLAELAVNNVEHSSSLNEPTTLISLALLLSELPLENISFVQTPTVSAPNNPNRVIFNEALIGDFWSAIHDNEQLALQEKSSGVIISEEQPQENTPQEQGLISVNGMSAADSACSNGAG